MLAFVKSNASELLGYAPPVFPVSARNAMALKQRGDTPPLGNGEDTGNGYGSAACFGELEAYVHTTLGDAETKVPHRTGCARRECPCLQLTVVRMCTYR